MDFFFRAYKAQTNPIKPKIVRVHTSVCKDHNYKLKLELLLKKHLVNLVNPVKI